MIILDDDTQVFQAVLAGAVNSDQPEFQVSYGQLNADALISYLTNQGELNSTTDVALVAGVASRQIGIKSIAVFNRDDAQVVVTFKKDISATDRFVYRVVLEVNESVHYESARGWYVVAATGIEKVTQVVEVNDLSSVVTWANIPDANVPESAVTQHEAALAIVEGQITGAAFTNWNNAFGWGDHDLVGYLTGEATHTGQVTGDVGLILDVTAITAQTELASGLISTDEVIVNDGGVLKRMDISVLEAYLSANLISGLTFGLQFFIATGADATYIIDQFASFAYTIVDAVAETVSGTITLEVNIDGTEVTGISAMAITSTESTDTASGQNSVAAGATVDFIFTSNSSALGLSVKLNCTRD